jgi:hypothetical protein
MKLVLLAVLVDTAAGQGEPKILTDIAGLFRCIGIKDVDTAVSWGCPVDSITDCTGATTKKAGAGSKSSALIQFACAGQNLKNSTSQDGMPVTFNFPVDMNSLKPDHFVWHFPDGTSRAAACAIKNGGPASEGNEQQTIALIGNAGGWTNDNQANALEIVGDLLLLHPNGTKLSAKGLMYSGPALNYSNGPILLTADLEVFSTKGETMTGKVFPNHCRTIFPDTTHRIRLLFDGGVSLDAVKQITPDRTDLIEIHDASGQPLDNITYLGLADLGAAPMPKTQCEKDTYATDGDNYLDVCLKLTANSPMPAKVHLPCTPSRQISLPKGLRYPCAKQTLAVSAKNAAAEEAGWGPFAGDEGSNAFRS